MRRGLLALLFLAPAVSAQVGVDSLGYVAGIFGMMSLLYCYQLIYKKHGLDNQIAKQTALITKLQEEIDERQHEVQIKRKQAGANMDGRVMEELKKAQAASDARKGELTKGYWDRIQQMSAIVPVEEKTKEG
jgi:hypothetical protein